jgi:host factor-I protein
VSKQVVVMRETVQAMPAERHTEPEFANRKLIRPALPAQGAKIGRDPALNHANHTNHSSANHSGAGFAGRERPERGDRGDRADRSNGARKAPPPDQTNAENFYYQKQMQTKTPMVIVLADGEEVHGTIEWYDRACIKVSRIDSPNLMIYKPSIKYMYKEGENRK